MTTLAANLLTVVAVSAGLFFFLAGTVGLLRFPTRSPGCMRSPKADTLGLGLVVLGLLPRAASPGVALKLVGLWLLTLLASGSVSQLIRPRRAARRVVGVTARLLDVGLVLVVLGMAAWIIVARQTVAAVMGFVAYGLLLSLVWLRLGAPDVALTEVAIGGGLSGVLMLGAAGRSAGRVAAGERTRARTACRGGRAVGRGRGRPGGQSAVAAGSSAHVGARSRRQRRCDDDRQSGHKRADGVSRHGHDVGEGGVVAGADRRLVAGAGPLLGGRPGQCHRADPNGPLAFLARVLTPIGIVVGFYVLWVSAEYPGGAFQGGTLLAAMWLLVMMAGLTDAPPTGRRWVRLVLIAGPAVFLLVGLGGMLFGDAFLAYPVAWAKPLILTIELAMIVTVAVTLGLLMAGVPERGARE